MATVSAPDIARRLFDGVEGRFRAVVEAVEPGVIAGLGLLDQGAVPAPSGQWRVLARDGERVVAGDAIIEVTGSAAELTVAEDYIMGVIGFASGVATRAETFARARPPGLRIACGGWKKLPAALKPLLRAGLATADILPRLFRGDFVYLGKNAVTLLGGVASAVGAARALDRGPVSIQVKTVDEAAHAVEAGAGIIMVDTGVVGDLAAVHAMLVTRGWRDRVTLAFGGGVLLDQLAAVRAGGADAVDVGRAILDAPLLDIRLRITERDE